LTTEEVLLEVDGIKVDGSLETVEAEIGVAAVVDGLLVAEAAAVVAAAVVGNKINKLYVGK
jgi:hypothetical protein